MAINIYEIAGLVREYGVVVAPWREADAVIDQVSWIGGTVTLVIGAADPSDPAPDLRHDVVIHVARFRDITSPEAPGAPTRAAVTDLVEWGATAEGIVLVCCNGAYGRSPALAAGIIARRHQLSMTEALAVVRRIRPVCRPNPLILSHLDGEGRPA